MFVYFVVFDDICKTSICIIFVKLRQKSLLEKLKAKLKETLPISEGCRQMGLALQPALEFTECGLSSTKVFILQLCIHLVKGDKKQYVGFELFLYVWLL